MKSDESLRMVIVRHAHRDLSDRTLDNGLSPKGYTQALEFLEWFRARGQPQKAVLIVTSPKLRCIETIEPLAQQLKVSPIIDPGLDEEHEGEGQRRFSARVADAITRLAALARSQQISEIVACSHGDWIPVACDLISGQNVNLGKGQWIELDLNR